MRKIVIVFVVWLCATGLSKTAFTNSTEYDLAISDLVVTGRLNWTSITKTQTGVYFQGEVRVTEWITTGSSQGSSIPIYYVHANELEPPPDFSKYYNTSSVWLLTKGINSLAHAQGEFADTIPPNFYTIVAIKAESERPLLINHLAKDKFCLRYSITRSRDGVEYFLRIQQRNLPNAEFPFYELDGNVFMREPWQIEICKFETEDMETSCIEIPRDKIKVRVGKGKKSPPENFTFEMPLNKFAELSDGLYAIKLVSGSGLSSNEIIVDIHR